MNYGMGCRPVQREEQAKRQQHFRNSTQWDVRAFAYTPLTNRNAPPTGIHDDVTEALIHGWR